MKNNLEKRMNKNYSPMDNPNKGITTEKTKES